MGTDCERPIPKKGVAPHRTMASIEPAGLARVVLSRHQRSGFLLHLYVHYSPTY